MILSTPALVWHYYCLHFINEETEAKRAEMTWSRSKLVTQHSHYTIPPSNIVHSAQDNNLFNKICVSIRVFKSVCMYMLSRVQLFATPWTVACQAPLSIGFPRQKYWSGLPFPSPGDLPNPGIELTSHVSFISSVFSTTSATWEAPTSSINNILGVASYTKQAPVSKTTCV